MNNKMLQVETSDGIYLHGYHVPTNTKDAVVLHIHGFEGNFYENNFVYVLEEKLRESDIGFLTVNTRGNGKDTDFNTSKGNLKRIGARFELLEEAHLDITAWIDFLVKFGYKRIILQGHSLGTMKVVRYLSEGKYKNQLDKLILLAPFDKKGLMYSTGRNNIGDLLERAKKKIDEGKGEELITSDFEEITLSYKTFVSWYNQDDLGRVFEFCTKDYDFPVLKKINVPTKIIVGSDDEYFYQSNPEHPEEAMQVLLKYIPKVKGKIIDGAVHSFSPHEDVMADEVVKFVLGEK